MTYNAWQIWNLITEIGGIVVLGPLALIMAMWLLIEGKWRLALSWCVLYGGGMVVVMLTKFVFIGWGLGSRSLDFTGLSGHAMRAFCVFPVLMVCLFYRSSVVWQHAARLFGLLVAGLISYSRIVVYAHTWSEVISGACLGALLAWWMIRLLGTDQHFRFNRALVCVSLLGLLFTKQAPPAPTHSLMVQLTLKITGHPRPFVREGWRYDPYYCVEPQPGVTHLCGA